MSAAERSAFLPVKCLKTRRQEPQQADKQLFVQQKTTMHFASPCLASLLFLVGSWFEFRGAQAQTLCAYLRLFAPICGYLRIFALICAYLRVWQKIGVGGERPKVKRPRTREARLPPPEFYMEKPAGWHGFARFSQRAGIQARFEMTKY